MYNFNSFKLKYSAQMERRCTETEQIRSQSKERDEWRAAAPWVLMDCRASVSGSPSPLKLRRMEAFGERSETASHKMVYWEQIVFLLPISGT